MIVLSPEEIIPYTLLAMFLYYIFSKNEQEKNIYYANLFLKSKVLYRNKYIRVSVFYLFEIKVKDKYFLIKTKKSKKQYRPVGKAIKWVSAAKKELDRFEIKNDKNVSIKD